MTLYGVRVSPPMGEEGWLAGAKAIPALFSNKMDATVMAQGVQMFNSYGNDMDNDWKHAALIWVEECDEVEVSDMN